MAELQNTTINGNLTSSLSGSNEFKILSKRQTGMGSKMKFACEYYSTSTQEKYMTLDASNGGTELYPMATSSSLGTISYPWGITFTNTIQSIQSGTNQFSYLDLKPNVRTGTPATLPAGVIRMYPSYNDGTMKTCGPLLVYPSTSDVWMYPQTGSLILGSSQRTCKIYGTIVSSSDRQAKTDIHYVDEPQLKMRTMSATTQTSFSTDDILSFIRDINPCTFVYKNDEKYTDIVSAINSNNTEMTQLGLIADDIKDEPLFNFIGATMEYDKVIEPEETDEEGNVTKEAVTEKATTLGLKPVPLAVAALTACKHLLAKVDELESRLAALEQ